MRTPTLTQTARTVGINLALPADLHKQLKIHAAMDGITVKQAVIAAIRLWVTNR